MKRLCQANKELPISDQWAELSVETLCLDRIHEKHNLMVQPWATERTHHHDDDEGGHDQQVALETPLNLFRPQALPAPVPVTGNTEGASSRRSVSVPGPTQVKDMPLRKRGLLPKRHLTEKAPVIHHAKKTQIKTTKTPTVMTCAIAARPSRTTVLSELPVKTRLTTCEWPVKTRLTTSDLDLPVKTRVTATVQNPLSDFDSTQNIKHKQIENLKRALDLAKQTGASETMCTKAEKKLEKLGDHLLEFVLSSLANDSDDEYLDN